MNFHFCGFCPQHAIDTSNCSLLLANNKRPVGLWHEWPVCVVQRQISHPRGIVAEMRPEARLPLSPSGSGHADDLDGSEGIEAVDECDAAVGMVSGQALPERAAIMAYGQMHLAPPLGDCTGQRLATARYAVLAGLPFSVAKELDAGAVHQQVQWPAGTAIGDLHPEGLLSAAQRRVVWNGWTSKGAVSATSSSNASCDP